MLKMFIYTIYNYVIYKILNKHLKNTNMEIKC